MGKVSDLFDFAVHNRTAQEGLAQCISLRTSPHNQLRL